MVERSRKFYIHKSESEIRTNNETITRNETTILTLRKSNFNSDYISSQVEKLSSRIKELLGENDKIKQTIDDISSGLHDKEYEKTIETSNNSYDKKYKEKKEKKEKASEVKKQVIIEQKQKKKNFVSTASEREMDNSLKYFYKCCESVPEYMSNNLKSMPNNKGYIWRGVLCYGEAPPEEKKPVVIFEKRGNVSTIHEFTEATHTVYEKTGDEQRKLISKTPRKVFKFTN